tara:strand:- start:10167 stop:12056 length:1890 start_codon:yes stop_codon:yes gene_type:complete
MSKLINSLKKDDINFIKRVRIINSLFIIIFLIIIGKIFYLGIIDNEAPLKFSAGKSNPFVLSGERGNIYDTNGEILATSVKYPSIFINPRAIKDKDEYAKILSKELGLEYNSVRKKLNSKKYFVWIKRLVNPKVGKKIQKLNLKFVGIQMESKRIYPSDHLAGQLLGHTNIDQQGMEGIEYEYNKLLSGKKKTINIYKDGNGKVIAGNSMNNSSNNSGSNLTLTINSKYQFILEEELEKTVKDSESLRGYGVIMNPNTGEIYAMASYPFFNPNNFTKYNELSKKNLPIWNLFEPGSIMKSFLVASAIDNNNINETTIIDCENGKRKIGGHTIRDVNPKGKLDPEDILRFSSNIGASKIIEKLTGKKYYEYLKSFGFGKKTNIGLPGEGIGMLTTPDKWSKIKLANISFGQGLSVSSLQLARALSIIANGGIFIEPHIIKKIEKADGEIIYSFKPKKEKRVLKYQTTKIIRDMLKEVVQTGSAFRANIKGLNVSGKTGTAQFAESGKYHNERFMVSFIGFAPTEQPKLVTVITIDYPKGPNAYGGRWAAPTFKRTIEKIMIDEEPPSKVSESRDTPSFIGKAKKEAIKLAKENKIKIKIYGNGFVKRQEPAPGEEISYLEEINIFLEPGI